MDLQSTLQQPLETDSTSSASLVDGPMMALRVPGSGLEDVEDLPQSWCHSSQHGEGNGRWEPLSAVIGDAAAELR